MRRPTSFAADGGALRARGAIGRASHRLRSECPFSADHRPRVN